MAKLDAFLPMLIMAILFVAVVRTIIVSQNPQKRAEARRRESEAEQADPRFADIRSSSDPSSGSSTDAQ